MPKLSSVVVAASVASMCAIASLSACGGKVFGVLPDGGLVSEGGGEGGACLDIVPSAYDQSCVVDSDCYAVASGNYCNNGCLCPTAAINKNALTSYQAAIASLPSPCASAPPGQLCDVGCGCPFGGNPACVAGTCTLCLPAPGGSGCASIGDGGSETSIISDEASVGEGSTGIVEAGFGEAGFGEASTGSSEGGGACVDIVASSFDQACKTSADCVSITAGTLCDGACDCGGATINKAGLASYDAEISGLSLAECPCPNFGAPTCVAGACKLCGFKTPGCPDGGA